MVVVLMYYFGSIWTKRVMIPMIDDTRLQNFDWKYWSTNFTLELTIGWPDILLSFQTIGLDQSYSLREVSFYNYQNSLQTQSYPVI